MSKEFEVRFEGSLAGSPVDVWEAITRGTAGWWWPVGYESRLGGAVTGLSASGDRVTVWDPPRHLSVRGDGEDGWFNNLDYVLESWDRGTFLRYTHTGVLGEEDWDDEYAACQQHTAFYYHSLREYIAHFKGRKATYVSVDGPEASATPGAFQAVRDAIGLPDNGDTVRFEVPGLDPVEGVVDYRTANFVGVRTVDGLYRFYGRDAFNWPVNVAHHLFAAEVDGEKAERAWAAWLEGLYG